MTPTMMKEATHKKSICWLTHTTSKPGKAQLLFGKSRQWLSLRQGWYLERTQDDTHFWDPVLNLQIPYMSIFNVFPMLAGAKHLGPGSTSGSSPGSEHKPDPQGKCIRSWGHILVSISLTIFLPTFRIRGKRLLFTCPLRPQRVKSYSPWTPALSLVAGKSAHK